MSTPTIDYEALARQAGAVNVDPPTSTPQAASPAPPKAGTGAVDYDALARQAGAVDVQPLPTETPGQITNDVGNTVIVPKDGEDFGDTMRRAAAQGQKTTPEQINREVATMPGKAATVLAAAPAIGATGVSAAMLPETVLAAKNAILKHLAEQSPELFGHEAVKETLKRYAMDGARKALTGAAWAGGAEILHSIWDDVFGKKH
jgi:hypothetical protein